jgi:hypothetical protein
MAYYQLSRSDKSTYLARVIWLGRREIPRRQDVFCTSAAAPGEALANQVLDVAREAIARTPRG